MAAAQGWASLGVLVSLAIALVTVVLRANEGLRSELRSELGGLRREMTARFEGVEATMSARFDTVDVRIGQLDRDVQALAARVFRDP